MVSLQAVKPLKSQFSSLSWTHTHVNPIIKTISVLDIFRYNTAAKRYRKEQKRKAALGSHEESSDNDDDEGPSTSKKYAKEKRRKAAVG